MAGALTPPCAVAAIVLCVAGIAKLRRPSVAAASIRAEGLLIRALAIFELAVGIACLAHPSPASQAAMAALYGAFSLVAAVLARRQASCGCFGKADAPASPVQSVVSGALAVVALAATAWVPHSIGWLATQAPAAACASIAGVAGCAYATVVVYTQLPQAWRAWSGG